MTTLVCVGDTAPARRGKGVGESHLWSSVARTLCCYHWGRVWAVPRRVVVDLGYAGGGAPELAAEFEPHILVLTHSDRDHIGGIDRFFSASLHSLEQLWVPHEWGLLVEAAEALTARSGRVDGPLVTVEQIRSMGRAAEHGDTWPDSVAVTVRDIDESDRRSPEQEHIGEHQRSASVLRLDQRSDVLIEAITAVIEQERDKNVDWPPVPSPEEAEEVAADTVRKSSRIALAISAARARGVRVRYFSTDHVSDEVQPWLTSGDRGTATIVNAVEVIVRRCRVEEPATSFYLLARLTAQNRRALMPFLWASGSPDCCRDLAWLHREWPDYWVDTESEPDACKPWGALICSDSSAESARGQGGLAGTLIPWEHLSVMTAPHHGSVDAAHAGIWEQRQQHAALTGREIPVVLAGGTRRHPVTEEYTNLDRRLRACTRCRHGSDRVSRTVTVGVTGAEAVITPHCRR